jgi:hypothetical protein
LIELLPPRVEIHEEAVLAIVACLAQGTRCLVLERGFRLSSNVCYVQVVLEVRARVVQDALIGAGCIDHDDGV